MSANSPSGNPRKRLPVQPSEENLRKQAKRRAKLDGTPLAEAQHRLAVEYGSKNWAVLMQVVEVMRRGSDQLSNVRHEVEPLPKAVRARDVATVRRILSEGGFTQHDLDAGLAHAAWYGGDAPEVLAVRKELFDLLLDHGADPDGQYGSAYGPIVFGTGECLSPDGLQWLIDAGCDVTFGRIETKYGPTCPLDNWLGTYIRGRNDAKHRGIELLLARGAFVPPEISPPLLAIHRGDVKTLGDLLDADRSLVKRRFADMPYGNLALAGGTLLHAAVEFAELDCVAALLDRWADINARADVVNGAGGQTPAFHAVAPNQSEPNAAADVLPYLIDRVGGFLDTSVIATLREHGQLLAPMTILEYARHAAKSDWAPQRAIAERSLALLEPLDRRSAIRAACARNDVATVARTLDERPELLTPELWPPTYKAKSVELTRLLLDRGLDPNVSSAPRRAIDLAAYHSLPDIVDLLIARGADVTSRNKLGETPLDLLEAYEPRPIGDVDSRRVRNALISAGATPDIHSAVRSGDVDLVRSMLDADPSLVHTTEPWPPLFSAARAGRVHVVKLLIARGAAVDCANDLGNTPLWFVCQSPARAEERIAVAKVLLDAGANPRRECEDKSTPLHFAASRGPIEMVELLLRNNAKEWQTDKNGKKPLDYARDHKLAADWERIADLLDRPVIRDPHFKAAAAAIHTGDAPALRRLLTDYPNLIHDCAKEPDCYQPGYFGDPNLLWFVANNPNLIETMPANIVELAAAIIDAGAERADIDYTLELVMTSEPARKQGYQRPLMELLLARGGTVRPGAIETALAYGDIEPVYFLVERGHPITAPLAAGLGRCDDLRRLLASAPPADVQAALSLAVINGHTDAAGLCLDVGADVNAFSVVHTHATSAHQAALLDDVSMLRLLVDRGANLTARDTLWHGTPLGWALHEKKSAAAEYLRSMHAPD